MSGFALSSGQLRYILVVDSDWNERFTLSMLLQRFGYTVANTSIPCEGVEFLCVAPALAVFAETGDVGSEFAARLKADARFQDVPLIMVTNGADNDVQERVRQGELAGMLKAPIDPDSVFKMIQKVIEKGPRENIRIATALKAELRHEYGSTEGFATVLSQYGFFFRTLEPRPVHSRLAVSIAIGGRIVTAEAEVLYIVSFEQGPFCEPGMGMKFVTIAPEDTSLIKFFIYEQLGWGALPPGPGPGAGRA